MTPENLCCDSLTNPLGIDNPKPNLRWTLRAEGRDRTQTAWHILVASSFETLSRDIGDLWDSGRVDSGHLQAAYAGQDLLSRQRCCWKVRVWDEKGTRSGWSDVAWWEMGLLEPHSWSARWIESSVMGGAWQPAPVPFFRKEFTVQAAPVRARLYVTALGLHRCLINGQRVTLDEFAPGWTDYRHRVQYQAYDVGALIQAGPNVLGVLLGDGWFCGHVGNHARQLYGEKPRLLLQLEMEFGHGQRQLVVSDSSWTTRTGPILFSDIMQGESYDGRLSLGPWHSPGYIADGWAPALPAPPYEGALVAMQAPAVRATEERSPIAPPVVGSGWNSRSLRFDFGQNLVGWVRLRIRWARGNGLKLRFAEILDGQGNPYYENLRSAQATDFYTCGTDEEEVFEPCFTFHGFRYLEIIGNESLPEISVDDVRAVVLHTDFPVIGTFSCSNPLLNQLQQNIDWGLRGNFLDVPTDCPQRDERLGWTGDAQVFIRTACFLREVETFFTRWQQTFADSQYSGGGIPPVIPVDHLDDRPDHDAGPAWSDAVVICPYTVYLCYGNKRILEVAYPSICRYLSFLQRRSHGLIRSHPAHDGWGGFGDWLALDDSGRTDGGTRKDLIGTAFFAYSTRLAIEIAGALGKTADQECWRELHAKVVEAFQRRFVTADGLLAGATQTSYVLALAFDLIPPPLRANAVAELVRDIERRNHHLSTGFVGTPYLCRVLADYGHEETAFKLLEQTTFPSWLYPVTLGATTIWERWDGWSPERGFQSKGMNSFNHYAYGAIGAWMYASVAGIDLDPERPGGGDLLLRPTVGGSLSHARATWRGPRGLVACGWRLEAGNLEVGMTVPPATRALFLPPVKWSGAVVDLETGRSLSPSGKRLGRDAFPLGSGSYRLLCRPDGAE